MATIYTTAITNIDPTSATGGGSNISSSIPISQKGICWDTSSSPTIALLTLTTIVTTSTADFVGNLTSLTSGTTYYVRAYVTNALGTFYGGNVVFTTQGVITTPATAITATTATSGATSITGFTSITSAGVCWNTITSPTTSNNSVTNVLTGGSFTSNLTGLLPGTQYFVRSYIVDGGLTYYGDEIIFTTTTVLPTVTTGVIASITSTAADVSGNVTATGGATVTDRGVEYSLSLTMSSSASVSSGSGLGAFTASIAGLVLGTTYYVRAYATNTNGTSYGSIDNFTTLGGPTVETVEPYSITSISANGGVIINTIGGSAITQRGVIISTAINPTIANGVVFSDANYGNGLKYLVHIQNLTEDTTYYLRGYAVNTQGIGYGTSKIFSTLFCNPTTNDCDVETDVVNCTEKNCEYNIPIECLEYSGDGIVCTEAGANYEISSTIIRELGENIPDALNHINDNLCYAFNKAYIRQYLKLIKANQNLNIQFCNIVCNCDSHCDT